MTDTPERPRSVVNGKLLQVSPSQLKTFTSCQRKWGFEKIERLTPPPKKWLQVGTDIHAEQESYFHTGAQPKNASLYHAIGKGYLPPRGVELLIEHHLKDPELYAANVRVTGFIDLLDPRDPAEPHVLDLKTKSRFIDDWGESLLLTPEQLGTDLQMLIYARWSVLKFQTAKRVRLSHVYVGTKRKEAEPVSVTLPVELVTERWQIVPEIIERMHLAAQVQNASQLPPNLNACSDFGGCPWLDRCQLKQESKTNMAKLSDLLTATQTPAPVGLETTPTLPPLPGLQSIVPPDAPLPVKSATPAPLATQPVQQEVLTPAPAPEPVQPEAEPAPTGEAIPERTKSEWLTILRDDFATKAIQGLIITHRKTLDIPQIPVHIARLAYEIADAMLKIRAVPPCPCGCTRPGPTQAT